MTTNKKINDNSRDTTRKPPRRSLRRELYSILFVYSLAFLGALALARGCESDRESALSPPASNPALPR